MSNHSPAAAPDLRDLARRLLGSASAPLMPPVVTEGRRSLQNIVSTVVGGLRAPEVVAARKHFTRNASGDVAVLGTTATMSAHAAAVLSGFSAHLDDFDDTHLRSSCHASAAAFAAAWVAGQLPGARPESFFAAFVHGCEIQLRIGWGMMPWHYDRGWHMSGTVGSLGAAASAAIMLGLTEDQTAHALSLACSQSLGLREAFGTSGKPFHLGKAAANGLLAAELARAGLAGSPHALFGNHGYYAVLSEEHRADRVMAAFGEAWLLTENTYKPYPCGLVVHPLIDLGLALRDAGASAEHVARVEIRAHPIVRELTGNPDPRTPLEARFSGVHGFALGLALGRAGLPEFDAIGLSSDAVRQVRQACTLVDDESVGWIGAAGTVYLDDGTKVEAEIVAARGSLERPLTDAELQDKFVAQVEPVFGADTAALWQALGETTPLDLMLRLNRVLAS